ncbi:hypothetical protein BC834DRAFT_842391 [Gloeopeniophorella convolvens]|nr:hypothetical protein BC834DRAFT_842391 [Gloeopeniophorella convolvens]
MDRKQPSSSSPVQRFMIRAGLRRNRSVKRQPSLRQGRALPHAVNDAERDRRDGNNGGGGPERLTSESTSMPLHPNRGPSSSSTRADLQSVPDLPKLKQNENEAVPSRPNGLGTSWTHYPISSGHEPIHPQSTSIAPLTFPNHLPIVLKDDLASKERREDALRARGLLPAKLRRDLSAIEADEDRRLDVQQSNEPSVSGSDSGHSDAREIAKTWRTSNVHWTSQDSEINVVLKDVKSDPKVPALLEVPRRKGPLSPVTEVSPRTPTAEADLSPPVPPKLPPAASDRVSVGTPRSPPTSPRGPRSASRAGSSKAYSDIQEPRTSLSSMGRTPSSEKVTQWLQQSAPNSPSHRVRMSIGSHRRSVSDDMGKQPTQSLPSSPPASRKSFSHATKPSSPTSASSLHRPVSPSQLSESSRAGRSPRLPPSPRFAPNPRPAPAGPLPTPPTSVSLPRILKPIASAIHLRPSVSGASTSSPTSPTMPSLIGSSSSELSHSTMVTDNGELVTAPVLRTVPVKGRRANIAPIIVKSAEEAFLRDEIIIETSEGIQDDDFNPYILEPPHSAPTIMPQRAAPNIAAAVAPQRKSLGFFSKAKKRAATLGTSPPAEIAKSASVGNLRRAVTNAVHAQPRPRSTLSPLDATIPRSPPAMPLNPTMHSGASISERTSAIVDDESRRLSELAFVL